MPTNEKILVAMSGGVDSSTAALLLADAGHEVAGATLRLTDDERAAIRAAEVCAVLGIPHHVLDARAVFRDRVIAYFVAATREGLTPNPCARCNPRIKFGWLLEQARALGFDALATGHYARRAHHDGRWCIRRGEDPAKEQSYFLFALSQDQLAAARFPLGDMVKPHVRELAAARGLPAAQHAESQDLCFVADGQREDFLAAAAPELDAPGDIVDPAGNVLGTHRGVYRYTIGQRQGLGLSGGPWYVVALDPAGRRVVVGRRADASGTHVQVREVNWMLPPPAVPFSCGVRIRYNQRAVRGTVTPAGDTATVTFAEPVFAITPGQAAVFYQEDLVLGGGWVTCGNPRSA